MHNQNYKDYYICPCGRVYSYKQKKFLKSHVNNKGYQIVTLRQNNINLYKTIHRLVAETYLENPESKSQVDHIDGNKNNNTVDNLRWVTVYENRHNPNTSDKHYGHFHSKSGYIYKHIVNGKMYEDMTYLKRRLNKHGA